ncbi:MAG: ABC transporter substrate-binding protein [Caldilineaceae bacterium]|nr:ABC transporter substrate-binding protein [Caldilineaceae bacterium]
MAKRRFFLPSALALLFAALLISGCTSGPVLTSPRDPQLELTLIGAPVPPTVLVTHMTNSPDLAAISERVIFERTDDINALRQGIDAGRIHGGMASTTTLAVLRNEGAPVQIVDVFGWELLYLLSGEKEIDSWESLRGSKVAVAYRGSVTDVIFQYLAAQGGVSVGDDLVMRYAREPLEAAEVLAGKQVQAAVLGEPWTTVAIFDGEEADEPVHRAMNLQEEWGALLGTKPRIPQVAFFVTDSLAAEHPEMIAALHAALIDAADWAAADPDAAAADVARLTRLSEAVSAESLAYSGLTVVPAAEARPELERMFQVLYDANPELIGGKLPDDGFYGE